MAKRVWVPVLAALSISLSSVAVAASEAAPGAGSGSWTPYEGCPDATCADGSDPLFVERVADRTKVVLYFEGGGACFSEETCAFDGEGRTYIPSSDGVRAFLEGRGGIFDPTDPENPLADHTFVYVPYCTGDVHLGTVTHTYGDDLVVEHRGFVNAMSGIDHVVDAYPDVESLVVAGMSAGSIPTPLMAALAADRLPDARIVSVGDSSGAYPDDPVVNAYLGGLWGTGGSIPDWPETEGVGLDGWSVPGLTVRAGQHAPGITFARFDHATDATQAFYGELVGVDASDLASLMDEIELSIEAAGVPVTSFVAPGDDHTILDDARFYTLEVDGVRLVDWLRQLVEGGVPDDVRCGTCGPDPGA